MSNERDRNAHSVHETEERFEVRTDGGRTVFSSYDEERCERVAELLDTYRRDERGQLVKRGKGKPQFHDLEEATAIAYEETAPKARAK